MMRVTNGENYDPQTVSKMQRLISAFQKGDYQLASNLLRNKQYLLIIPRAKEDLLILALEYKDHMAVKILINSGAIIGSDNRSYLYNYLIGHDCYTLLNLEMLAKTKSIDAEFWISLLGDCLSTSYNDISFHLIKVMVYHRQDVFVRIKDLNFDLSYILNKSFEEDEHEMIACLVAIGVKGNNLSPASSMEYFRDYQGDLQKKKNNLSLLLRSQFFPDEFSHRLLLKFLRLNYWDWAKTIVESLEKSKKFKLFSFDKNLKSSKRYNDDYNSALKILFFYSNETSNALTFFTLSNPERVIPLLQKWHQEYGMPICFNREIYDNFPVLSKKIDFVELAKDQIDFDKVYSLLFLYNVTAVLVSGYKLKNIDAGAIGKFKEELKNNQINNASKRILEVMRYCLLTSRYLEDIDFDELLESSEQVKNQIYSELEKYFQESRSDETVVILMRLLQNRVNFRSLSEAASLFMGDSSKESQDFVLELFDGIKVTVPYKHSGANGYHYIGKIRFDNYDMAKMICYYQSLGHIMRENNDQQQVDDVSENVTETAVVLYSANKDASDICL